MRQPPSNSLRMSLVERKVRMTTLKESVVHSDPDIMGGEPVFVGTRVPVKTLFEYLEEGDTIDEFLDQFPSVRREQARAALEIGREAVEAVANSHR